MDTQNTLNPYQGLTQEGLNVQLREAAENDHRATADLLIQKGADVNASDNHGWTALVLAVRYGHTATANLLIQKGANINVADNDGMTALMLAAQRGNTATAYRLLSAMTVQERQAFANISIQNNTLVTEFNQELKNQANKIYNIMMPSCLVGPGIFQDTPFDIINYIKIFEALVQDFPDWYQHRILIDLESTLKFVNERKKREPVIVCHPTPLVEPVIFSQLKRTAEGPLEEKENHKKVKTTHHCDEVDIQGENNNDRDDNDDDKDHHIEVEPENSYSCSIQ